ncbi:MAG: DUF1552 domain-containing protein [Chitinophagaceae bacterium]|nr:DUF1552 domain-containing protein [Oligoflexus sp.]
MERRLFLKGTGGVIFGLPILESLFWARKAQAATTPPPYAIFLYQPMGPEKDTWWPSTTGKLTKDTLAGRGVEPLADYLDKLLIIKGLGHGNEEHFNAGDHGEGVAMTLSAARVDFGGGGETNAKSLGPSIDSVIAKALGGSPLNLGAPDGGGISISWSAAKVENAPEYDPLKAYKTLFPNGESKGTAPLVDDKAALRKGVNDLVRQQMKDLLANPQLSKNDKDRLELHMSNIRDLENTLLGDHIMPDADRNAIQAFKGDAWNSSSRATTPKMLADIIAIAAASGQKRVMTLQLGSYMLDTEYDISGVPHGGNWHEGVSHANDKTKLQQFDLLNQRNFAYLLKALSQYKFEDNGKTLLDYGLSTFIISLGFGAGHWRYDLPHIIAGSANGVIAQGQYLDLVPAGQQRNQKFVPTNRLFSSIGKAVGAAGTENFNAGTAPRDATVRLDQKGIIDQMFV